MSGDVRVLRGGAGLAAVVDGLHVVSRQLDGLPYALVGGVAVLVHVQGHRVTEDIDSAVRAFEIDARQRLKIVADADLTARSDALVVLPSGVPVDVLTAGFKPPRRGIGARREARGHAVRWAVETATDLTVTSDPAGTLGPVSLPVATPAALVAMKTVSSADPDRGRKVGTDLLDIWRLLSDNPVRTAALVEDLCSAPERLLTWTRQRLHELLLGSPGDFVRDMASGPGGSDDIAEVRELYLTLVEPLLGEP